MPEEFGATAAQQLIVVDSEGYKNIFTINLCSLEPRSSSMAVLGQIYSVTVEVVSMLIAPEHNEKEPEELPPRGGSRAVLYSSSSFPICKPLEFLHWRCGLLHSKSKACLLFSFTLQKESTAHRGEVTTLEKTAES